MADASRKVSPMALQMLKPKLKAINVNTVKMLQVTPGSWRSGKTSAARGYGYKWQQAREGYLRSHPLCVMCQRDGRVTAATVVDHSIAHRGDMELFWKSEHWQALCKPHHDTEAQRRDKATG